MNDDAGKHSKLSGILLTIGAVVFVALIGVYLSSRPEPPPSDMEQMAGNVSEMMDDMLESVESADFKEGKPFIDKTFSTESDVEGPMGEVQAFVAQMMNESVQMTNRYAAELESVGYLNLLNPQRMMADSEFAESYRILADVDELVSKYRGLHAEQVDSMLEKIDTINASEAFKTGMKAGMASELKESEPVREQIWDLEQKAVDEVRLLVDFLQRGDWSSEGGQFVFETDEGLAVFNGHIANINAYTEEQMALRRSQVKSSQQKLQGM